MFSNRIYRLFYILYKLTKTFGLCIGNVDPQSHVLSHEAHLQQKINMNNNLLLLWSLGAYLIILKNYHIHDLDKFNMSVTLGLGGTLSHMVLCTLRWYPHDCCRILNGFFQLMMFLQEIGHEVQGYAMYEMSYSSIMVLDSLSTNWKSLIQPFDWMIWTSLFSATYLIALLLHLELELNQIRPGFHVLRYALNITSLLLNQSVWNKTTLKKDWICCAIWILWGSMALIFTILYKGTLLSFQFNPEPPITVPDSLPCILQTNMVIATQSAILFWRNGRKFIITSRLNETLKDMFIEQPEFNQSVYRDLYRKLKWIGDDYKSTTIDILQRNRILNKISNESTDLGKGFFVIDDFDQVELFKLYLSFFTEKWKQVSTIG
ncbi:unnamed protein product [Orchesella dallaii]|uniref:Uncharacterized protein n=1 Tax=Orchesella dallaii TaxID=48710 RepID=A0ABP1RN23_9HEXA